MEKVVGGKLQGKHVLYMLLSFFGVMVTVNGIFVYFALTSFSGLSVEDSYKRGLNYNKIIATAESQASREWVADLEFESLGNSSGLVTLHLVDKNGEKIRNLNAQATIRRPLGQYEDRSQVMVMTREGFETEIEFEAEGQWDLIVQITGAGYEQPFRLETRIWVK